MVLSGDLFFYLKPVFFFGGPMSMSKMGMQIDYEFHHDLNSFISDETVHFTLMIIDLDFFLLMIHFTVKF